MTAAHIALVTFPDQPGLHPDDHLLVSALASRGVRAVPTIWSDPAVDWSTFDAALLRSTWDYFHRRAEFLAWASRVDAITALYNPLAVVAWNSDKRYLRDLEARGLPTVPTVWRESGEALDLEGIVAHTGWSRLVVKPAISAGAFATLRVEDDAPSRVAAEAELAEVARTRAFLVQPYLRGVANGEVSLFYFSGHFSHAVNKRPLAGEFRVQERFGGLATAHEPSATERAVGERVLSASADVLGAEELLYARVDLLAGDEGAPRLIELEAIEPFLFLSEALGAADRLATALLDRLARDRG